MYSYEEKMRAVELYLKYGLSAAAVINELEQHVKKNKLPAKDQRVVLSHNNYIMVVVRLSATIRHFRLQSKNMCPLLVTSHVQSCTAYSIHEKRYEIWSKHEAPTLAGQRNLRKQDAIMTSKAANQPH